MTLFSNCYTCAFFSSKKKTASSSLRQVKVNIFSWLTSTPTTLDDTETATCTFEKRWRILLTTTASKVILHVHTTLEVIWSASTAQDRTGKIIFDLAWRWPFINVSKVLLHAIGDAMTQDYHYSDHSCHYVSPLIRIGTPVDGVPGEHVIHLTTWGYTPLEKGPTAKDCHDINHWTPYVSPWMEVWPTRMLCQTKHATNFTTKIECLHKVQ